MCVRQRTLDSSCFPLTVSAVIQMCRAPQGFHRSTITSPHGFLASVSPTQLIQSVQSPDYYHGHFSCPAGALSLSPPPLETLQSVLKLTDPALSQIPAAFTSCGFPSWHHSFRYHIISVLSALYHFLTIWSTLAMVSLLKFNFLRTGVVVHTSGPSPQHHALFWA